MAEVIETTDWAEWGIRYLARGLALIWALSWVFFGIASGIGEELPFGGVVAHTALPGLVFLLTAFIAWRWETLGAILLLSEGSLVALYFLNDLERISLLGIFFVILTATIPAFFIGFLFLISWRRSKFGESTESTAVDNNI